MSTMPGTLVYALAGVLAVRSAAAASPTAPVSLDTCQKAVKTATAAFMQNKVAAVGACLQAVSTQIVAGKAPASAAVATCVRQFRTLVDSRGMGKQLSDRLTAAVFKKCAPGQPHVTHTLADIIGAGAGVPRPLDAQNLNASCSRYGGDGAIDTLQEWIDCMIAVAECTVDNTITSQYPRALEWLALVRTQMEQLPAPPADPSRISDAVAGLDAVKAAIDGPNNDGIPSIQCGGGAVPATCGNGVTDPPAEQCDGNDQGGQSCVSLGFSGGTLTCNMQCRLNLGSCSGPGQLFSVSGQTTAYPADKDDGVDGPVAVPDDGTLQTGARLGFVDNGDGTITDLNTHLMWEKKSDDGSLHDKDNTYVWSGGSAETIWRWLDELNAVGGTGFAGKNDWRIPNMRELESIIDYDKGSSDYTGPPAVSAAFNTGCASGYSVLTCSCTQTGAYWSSTTRAGIPRYAWLVNFAFGSTGSAYKDGSNLCVRAVRGGS